MNYRIIFYRRIYALFLVAVVLQLLMTLAAYSNLIRHLPYLDQAFETQKSSWQKECNINSLFSKYCKGVFKEETLKLSRRDCFAHAKQDFVHALFAIIFWGYPRNMRGNSFSNVLKSLQTIQDAFPTQQSISEANFKELVEKIKKTGVGLSTLTKLLYFFNVAIDGKRCLILDSRIIEVLNDGLFDELRLDVRLSEFNKTSKYIAYLEMMQNIAELNGYKPDQLEFFLFHFGKNLKSEVG
jgi:hypothetical protein